MSSIFKQFLLGAYLTLLIPPVIAQDDSLYINWINEVLKGPERQLINYQFDPNSTLISRVKEPNRHFLAYIQSVEPQASSAGKISQTNLETVQAAINLLPPLHKSVMLDRLVEICFVESLGSSGWTDWLVDDDGKLYCVTAFDKTTLDLALSDWLEARAKTVFKADGSSIDININVGDTYSGFLGILLHEATHIVDFVQHITPFVETSTYALGLKQGRLLDDSYPFIEGIWVGQNTPVTEYSYPLRDSLTFYLENDDRKLAFADADELYQQLAGTPFVSLIGSKSWAQDLAEIVTFYHLTHILKQPYTISVTKAGEVLHSYKPMESQTVIERLPLLDMFYHTD